MATNTRRPYTDPTGPPLATYIPDDNAAAPEATVVTIRGKNEADIAPVSATDGLLVNLGANNDVTVSGVSTAANQTTIIGHVDGIEALLGTIGADTSALAGAVSGAEMQVDVVTSALPSGAATAANQTTIIGHVDGIEGLLTTIDADTGNILTALQLIDDTVATLGTTTYTEATTKGLIIGAVRQDADTTLVNTTNEVAPLQVDANGHLKVKIFDGGGSHTVDNAGTFAVQVDGSALTALQLIDDPVIADDAAFTPATSKVMMAGFQADEASTDSVDEGDAGAARMSLDRKQYVIAHSETSTIYQNGTARTPVFAAIDVASSGDNTLLAAQGAGNKIRVHQLFLVSAGTVTVRFESGAGGTALTGQMNLVANTGFVLPFSPIGWFETAANTLLNLELSAAVSVDGNFAYTVVT